MNIFSRIASRLVVFGVIAIPCSMGLMWGCNNKGQGGGGGSGSPQAPTGQNIIAFNLYAKPEAIQTAWMIKSGPWAGFALRAWEKEQAEPAAPNAPEIAKTVQNEVIPNLKPGVVYKVKFYLFRTDGAQIALSETATAEQTPDPTPTVEPEPEPTATPASEELPGSFSITASDVVDGSLQLSWSSSTKATSYLVKYGTESGSYANTLSESAVSPAVFSNLPPQRLYIQVIARNADGDVPASAEAVVTIPLLLKQHVYAKASNATAGVHYGTAVAMHGDSFAVGAPSDKSNAAGVSNGATASADTSLSNSGAVFVYSKSGDTWAQVAYVKPPHPTSDMLFGTSVALSDDTLVVGAPQESSNQTTITNGTDSSTDTSASSSGAVFVFRKTGSTWAQEAYIKPPNNAAQYKFGTHVALSGDTLVVGAPEEASNQTSVTNGASASSDTSQVVSGAAYVFVRNGTTWTMQAYLKPPNTFTFFRFGTSVGISGDRIVVGSGGESANQNTVTNGATASTDRTLSNSGAAYVFLRTGTTWQPEAYLKAPNAGVGHYFGNSVAISGSLVAVGAAQENGTSNGVIDLTAEGATIPSETSFAPPGAVYLFELNNGMWSPLAYVKPSNAYNYMAFGKSIALDGSQLLVGSNREKSNATGVINQAAASDNHSIVGAGAAFVYKNAGDGWRETSYLKAANPAMDAEFGTSVAISGNQMLIGAVNESSSQQTLTHGETASSDTSANEAGAVYLFGRR